MSIIPKIRELHYLITIKPSGRVVAHCLDLDIVTAANDVDEAEKRLDMLVRWQIEEALGTGNYSALTTAAPGSYFAKFDACRMNGKVREPRRPTLTVRVPELVPLDQSYSTIGIISATAASAAA